MSKPLRLPDVTEQEVLDQLCVRLIKPCEKQRWDQLVTERHYLRNSILVGEQLRYVAECQGNWMALLGWSAPAWHLKARDAWLEWSPKQLLSRRQFLAQNSRFLLLGERLQFPNLATRALALCCQRLSSDWLQNHGHPIMAVESFVDSQLFRGTAYKAAGWTLLGPTSGYGRCAEDFYERHNRPKQLWVRALDRQGTAALKEPVLPDSLAAYEAEPAPRSEVSSTRLPSLMERLPKMPDPRGKKGRWHHWQAVLGIICLAKLAGVPGAQREIAEFAQRLTQPQRKQLGCSRDPKNPNRRVVPGQSTFFRALKAVDYGSLEKTLIQWQQELLGPEDKTELVVIDGKTLRAAKKQIMLAAVSVPSGRVHAVEPVHAAETLQPEDSPSDAKRGVENEIPAVRRLVARTQLQSRLVAIDAMHTQHQTASELLFEAGADYLLTLKGNQAKLLASAQTLLPSVFFPSGRATSPTHCPHPGNQSWTTGSAPSGHSRD